ncbi:MAG: glycoside hydrolase family 28 protein [Ignavibacteriae bacterium]|nr:glycoside hydrolase family 28 protein [Ignavibacteriota bacterium]
MLYFSFNRKGILLWIFNLNRTFTFQYFLRFISLKKNLLTFVFISTTISNITIAQEKIFNVLSYGAKADSKTLNQTFIQNAIDDANINGGGKVIIPNGIFLTGSIILKSNVELFLESGAVLLGSTDISDYKNMNRWKSLILAENQKNIKISGEGIIDGQGRTLALKVDSLYYAGKLDSLFYNKKRKRPNEFARPQLIEFSKCNNVIIKNVTLKNSACWVQTYELCDSLKIDNIKVISDAYWNNDGLDIDNCKNVWVTNSYINSADDGICLKSTNADSYNENIVIENCTVRSSASAVKFGTASAGGFKKVTINNIKVFDTFRSAIALESVDGGIIEDISIKNIRAYNTRNAIFIKLGKRNKDEKVGILRNVKIKDLKVHIPFDVPDKNYEIRGPELPFFHNPFPSSITGYKDCYVENVTLEDIEIIYPGKGNNGLANIPLSRLSDVPENESEYPEFHMFGELPSWAFYIRHVKNLKMKNIYVVAENPDYRPAFVFDDVKKLALEKIQILEENISKKQIIFQNTEGLEIDEYSAKESENIK